MRDLRQMMLEYICSSLLIHSLVDSELENNQAQLLRFQLHLSSVKEDIQFMEEKLRSVIRACKTNQVPNCTGYTIMQFTCPNIPT